jgi:hypothetical protein
VGRGNSRGIDTYAGADSDQGSQGTLIECSGTLLLEDLGRAVQSTLILRGGLQADLYDIWAIGVRQASLWGSQLCAEGHKPKGCPVIE